MTTMIEKIEKVRGEQQPTDASHLYACGWQGACDALLKTVASDRPSSGAREQADKLVDEFKTGSSIETLRDRLAEQLQRNFDLGHKSAGGAQCDKVPAMGGLLEIALDQEEIDAVGGIVSSAEPKGERASAAVGRFLEKIELFRRKLR